MPSEWELIEKAKTGDREALSELVANCWQPLYRFVCYKTGSMNEAGDITQETFYRAFRSLGNYRRTEARFSTWLSRIAQNLILDLWRKNKRTPASIEWTDSEAHLADNDNPAEELVCRETRELLQQFLTELPPDKRRVIELRLLTGLPVAEVAIAVNKSEAAVKMLQQRGLKSLREKLLQQGVLS